MVNNGGNALCSVDNANELCSGAPASCSISSCTGGYVNADGVYTNGCECLPEASSGNSCAAAVSVGTLSDADSMTTITGNLDAIGDEDWYAVTMSQTVAAAGYKLQVVFTASPGLTWSSARQNNCNDAGDQHSAVAPPTTWAADQYLRPARGECPVHAQERRRNGLQPVAEPHVPDPRPPRCGDGAHLHALARQRLSNGFDFL
ncbi:MAG: hypothetical protein IPN77_26395 [Sandaracinaceae bacterium]|nr:hypothetical protein [Sandaracinaceae bacterium]